MIRSVKRTIEEQLSFETDSYAQDFSARSFLYQISVHFLFSIIELEVAKEAALQL